MERCPTCEREFKGIQDFPLVYVAKFERLEIPPDVKFPDVDSGCYVGPESDATDNKRPPKQVVEFFENNGQAKECEYDGWVWRLDERNSEPFPGAWRVVFIPSSRWSVKKSLRRLFSKKSEKNEIERFGQRGQDWAIGGYTRYTYDIKKQILSHLNPYFDKLETLVGKEVPTKEVLLPEDWSYRFPETNYELALWRIPDPCELPDIRQEDLVKSSMARNLGEEIYKKMLNLETPMPTRKLVMRICNVDDGAEVNYLANVAWLAYEGRLKKTG